jgi:hypothetical protein
LNCRKSVFYVTIEEIMPGKARFQSSTYELLLFSYELLEEKYKEHTKVYTDGLKKDDRVTCAGITTDLKIRKSHSKKGNPNRYIEFTNGHRRK